MLLLLALAALAGCLGLPRLLVVAEHSASPVFFMMRGPIAPPAELALVTLSLRAAEALGQPRTYFSRRLHAQLINQLTQAQAHLIVFDIAFKEPRNEDEDASLEMAIKNSNRVVLFDYLKRYQIENAQGRVDVEEIIPPLARFKQVALGSGSFVLPKTNALVGHIHPVLELHGVPHLSQPLQVLSLYAVEPWQHFLQKLKQEIHQPELDGSNTIWQHINQLSAQQKKAVLDGCVDAICQSLWRSFTGTEGIFINFYGPPGHLPQWPLDQVLAMPAQEQAAIFANKIVYVGLVEPQQTEQQDAYRTVFSNANGLDLSGVEISASVLGNLLHNQALTYLNYTQQSALLALWILALGLISQQLSQRLAWAVGVIWHLAYVMAAYWAFVQHYFCLPLISPLALSVVFVGLDTRLRLRANKLRYQNLITDLTHYMPAQAAKALSDHITNFAANNQLVSGVCLLTDIQGYTRLAEELPPSELHQLMNRYYAELIDEVKASGGIVANIVGDALLALWLDTHISADACIRASRTACAIQKRLAAQADLHRLPTSCAVHGGEFSLGHLGASGHFEYSPVGDMVNTVSRMEPFNRHLGTRILCSELVAEVLINSACEFSLRDLGAFNLRNKKTCVRFYQLYEPGINPAQNGLESLFKQALERYACAPAEALPLFQALTAQFPQDGPSRYYLQQSKLAQADCNN
jgi:adenylate cyclase